MATKKKAPAKRKTGPKPGGQVAREKRLVEVAARYCEGMAQMRIAEELSMSQGQVSLDIKELLKRWREEQLFAIDDMKARQLGVVDRIEFRAWEAFDKSQLEQTTEGVEREAIELEGIERHYDGETVLDSRVKIPAEKVKTTHKTVTTAGDPRFLAIALQCVKRRCEILGLDAPKQIEGTFAYHYDFSGATDKQFNDLGARLERYLS